MKTEVHPVDAPPEPLEVLFPEARAHRRRRYTRTGAVMVITALVIAGLVAAAVALWGGAADGKSQASPPPAGVAGRALSHVYFRPVFCAVPLFDPVAPTTVSVSPSSCTANSAMTARNLDVQPTTSQAGYNMDGAIPPDSALAGLPSTKPSADEPSATVLLPQIGPQRSGDVRYLLGPAQMSSASIASARVTRTSYGGWVVDFSTRNGALWDKVANENFHQELAIELNGVVYSAPLIQPWQSSFSSFDGKGAISGNLTKAEAMRLAAAMEPHRGS